MKPILTLIIVPAAAVLPLAAGPAAGDRLPMRDVVTTLAEPPAGEPGLANPIKNLKEVEKAAQLESPVPVSILSRCAFLSSQGATTLVPKGSVLHVPPRLKDQLRMIAGNRVVNWPEFFRRNRGWITTVEVSRGQAAGSEPIPERTLEAIQENERVVIATLQGGPISVLPPKAPAPEGEQAVQDPTEVAISTDTK